MKPLYTVAMIAFGLMFLAAIAHLLNFLFAAKLIVIFCVLLLIFCIYFL